MFCPAPFFPSGLETYFRAPLSRPLFHPSFQAGISASITSAGTKICLQLQLKACVLEVKVFSLDLWVSMFSVEKAIEPTSDVPDELSNP